MQPTEDRYRYYADLLAEPVTPELREFIDILENADNAPTPLALRQFTPSAHAGLAQTAGKARRAELPAQDIDIEKLPAHTPFPAHTQQRASHKRAWSLTFVAAMLLLVGVAGYFARQVISQPGATAAANIIICIELTTERPSAPNPPCAMRTTATFPKGTAVYAIACMSESNPYFGQGSIASIQTLGDGSIAGSGGGSMEMMAQTQPKRHCVLDEVTSGLSQPPLPTITYTLHYYWSPIDFYHIPLPNADGQTPSSPQAIAAGQWHEQKLFATITLT